MQIAFGRQAAGSINGEHIIQAKMVHDVVKYGAYGMIPERGIK